MKHVTYTTDQGIAILTLDNADEPVNLVSEEWLAEMMAAIDRLAQDDSVIGAVIVSGKSDFMAGADLKIVGGMAASGMSATEVKDWRKLPSDMHRRLETCGKPVVAAIHGFALGGGYELALACHRRIMTGSPRSIVGLPEVKWDLLPGSGGTQRLPRMIGLKKALPVLLEGKSYGAQKALSLGLVDEVVAEGDLIAAARAWLQTGPDPVRAWDKKGYAPTMAPGLLDYSAASQYTMQTAALSKKTNHNYPAPILITQAVFQGLLMPLDKALDLEGKFFAKLVTSPVARNLIRTNFLSKGKADRLDRRPEGVDKLVVKKIGVLGAGMMGAGIALDAAKRGIDVVLIDTDQAYAEKGKAYSEKVFSKDVAKGRMSQEKADAALSRITPTTEYDGLSDVDMIIEAVFEDVAIKAEVTRRAAQIMPEKAIFASNTSTLPISMLAQAFPRPEAFIGLHFFSPVERMELVEVIMGEKTDQATLAQSLDLVAQLRKTPIVVNDSRGFYTSRVFMTFIFEGMALLQDGVKPALIENAAKQAGFPVGPLSVTDEVTMDLPLKIISQAKEATNGAYREPVGAEVMRHMQQVEKRSGRKGGGGFYDYPEGGAKSLWSGLGAAFPVKDDQPEVEEVKKRLLYIQALETARCLEEGVITTPEDGDIGSLYGWSYPSYTGGTISLIDTVGLPDFVAACEDMAGRYGDRFAPSEWLRDKAASGAGFY